MVCFYWFSYKSRFGVVVKDIRLKTERMTYSSSIWVTLGRLLFVSPRKKAFAKHFQNSCQQHCRNLSRQSSGIGHNWMKEKKICPNMHLTECWLHYYIYRTEGYLYNNLVWDNTGYLHIPSAIPSIQYIPGFKGQALLLSAECIKKYFFDFSFLSNF